MQVCSQEVENTIDLIARLDPSKNDDTCPDLYGPASCGPIDRADTSLCRKVGAEGKENVENALRVMASAGVHCLLVSGADNKAIGIVSSQTLFKLALS